jgi:tetratricopeptide (TPR) repeat protein
MDDERGASNAAAGRRAAYAGLAIALLTLLAYLPALRAGFVWDDDHHFSANPAMTAPGGLAGLWTSHQFYYPLTSTTWWAMRRLFGLQPVPYHLLNILLHGLNAILLWRLARRLAIGGAWLAGAIFALHPVFVQSVAWATELKNCLSGLFFLLALHAWARIDSTERGRPGMWYVTAMIAFLAALLSKTSTVILPFALVVMDLWRGRARRSAHARRAAARWAPFFALALAAGLWTLGGHSQMVSGEEWALTPLQRLALAARCVWFYLGKLCWPSDLTFVYPRWTVDGARPAAWIPLLALFALVAALWALRRRGGWPALLALAWFVASLLPVLNFFRMYYARYTFVADHWQYLAAMGAIVWAAGSAEWLSRRWRPVADARLKPALATALLILLASLTWRQAKVYRDSETLWLSVLDRDPTAAIAYNNLGIHYVDRGEPAKAEAALRVGLERNPGDPELATILASVLIEQRRWSAALDLLTPALERMPGDAEILNNMALSHAGLGQTERAIEEFRAALAADPYYAAIYGNYIQTLREAGRRDEARAVIEEGLRHRPGDPMFLRLRQAMGDAPDV